MTTKSALKRIMHISHDKSVSECFRHSIRWFSCVGERARCRWVGTKPIRLHSHSMARGGSPSFSTGSLRRGNKVLRVVTLFHLGLALPRPSYYIRKHSP